LVAYTENVLILSLLNAESLQDFKSRQSGVHLTLQMSKHLINQKKEFC